MLKMNVKNLFAVLLSVLLIEPSYCMVASPATAPPAVLGSVTTRGTVRVGGVLMPSHGTLFSGDEVQTSLGSAIIQYQKGPRVQVAIESSVHFTSSHVQLQRGQMAFRTVSGNDLSLAASTLRLEPATTKTDAHVSLQDKKVSVSVTEGILNIVDPSGVHLASLRAGQASVFQEASAALPADPDGPVNALTGEAAVKWVLIGAVAAAVIYANYFLDRDDEVPVISPSTP